MLMKTGKNIFLPSSPRLHTHTQASILLRTPHCLHLVPIHTHEKWTTASIILLILSNAFFFCEPPLLLYITLWKSIFPTMRLGNYCEEGFFLLALTITYSGLWVEKEHGDDFDCVTLLKFNVKPHVGRPWTPHNQRWQITSSIQSYMWRAPHNTAGRHLAPLSSLSNKCCL